MHRSAESGERKARFSGHRIVINYTANETLTARRHGITRKDTRTARFNEHRRFALYRIISRSRGIVRSQRRGASPGWPALARVHARINVSPGIPRFGENLLINYIQPHRKSIALLNPLHVSRNRYYSPSFTTIIRSRENRYLYRSYRRFACGSSGLQIPLLVA